METIHVTLPDGNAREFPRGVTPLEVARKLDPKLAERAVVAEVNGDLVDLNRPLDKDTPLRILTPDDPRAVEVFRHSSAHLLAAAVLELFPETKLGHGPPTEDGFFYDFYRQIPFTPEDLEKIEKKMQELVKQDIPYAQEFLPRKEGLERFQAEGDFMKCHFIEQFTQPDEKISIYRTGKFVDFCRGPHLPSTGRIKAFKLLTISGAYWLGEEGNPQLQRIYGTSFFTQQELDEFLHRMEEARGRDHRRLGKELGLFSIQEEAGPGLIFWHPKGGLVRKIMEDWLRDELLRRGYDMVYTPHILRHELWRTSGHTDFYAQNMFSPIEVEKSRYQLKPMNCPGHILIYKSELRSYRDLPLRFAELGTVYRYERSGVLHGLLRVRGFTQDDAHIFCTPDQIESEIAACIDFAWAVLRTFGFERYEVELSAYDPKRPENYAGTPADWQRAEGALENTLTRMKIPFKRMEGEAVFYGPKIDVKLIDAIGRPWQLTTVQFDFNLPERFDLAYIAEDGKHHRPLMVHRALWGSIERFFGILIEHYAGAFPLWLAPVQVVVIPISEKYVDYARRVGERLAAAGLRYSLDDRNEKVNLKIREAQLQKVPYMLVVGAKEAAAGTVAVRHRTQGDLGPRPLDDLLSELTELIGSRSSQP